MTDGVRFAESRGNRKANDNYQLDLQVAKGFSVGPTLRFELVASVINAFSSERPEDVCRDVSGCADPRVTAR